jgi:hypothetical protein
VRIHFSVAGGFAHIPGLSQPFTLETEVLPVSDRARIEELVRAVDFFALPARMDRAGSGGADQRTYTITVEQADQSHTVQVVEPTDNPALAGLINTLRASRSLAYSTASPANPNP